MALQYGSFPHSFCINFVSFQFSISVLLYQIKLFLCFSFGGFVSSLYHHLFFYFLSRLPFSRLAQFQSTFVTNFSVDLLNSDHPSIRQKDLDDVRPSISLPGPWNAVKLSQNRVKFLNQPLDAFAISLANWRATIWPPLL